MTLAKPLNRTQIRAAMELRDLMPQWTITDRALHLLGARFSGFSSPETLLKVAALNQLYGTQVYAVPRMAEHISRLLEADPVVDADLIDDIALLPPRAGTIKGRRHLSFASKFGHFYLDGRLPIFDSFAARSLALHLGERAHSTDRSTYRDYVASIANLRESNGLHCSASELDRYLWISGMYRSWQANPASQLSVEAQALFSSESPSVTRLLRDLVAN